MAELGQPPVAQKILEYLVDHPEAQDTLAGIARWWLLEQQIKNQTAVVNETLSQLVAKGLLVQWQAEDSQVHYRINSSKLTEIKRLLEEKGR